MVGQLVTLGALKVHRRLGTGAAASVYLATLCDGVSGAVYAVKVSLQEKEAREDRGFDMRYWSEANCLSALANERKILARTDNPFIVKAYPEICSMPSAICLEKACASVQEMHEIWSRLFSPSDLRWIYIAEPEETPEQSMLITYCIPPAHYSIAEFSIGLPMLQYIARHWLLGLHYLFNEAKIVNRDIKVGNLLVRADFSLCISDFGSAGDYSEREAQMDLQRLGCQMWLLATGQGAYHYLLPRKAMHRLCEANVKVDRRLKSFVLACYSQTIESLLHHPFVSFDSAISLEALDVGEGRERLSGEVREILESMPERVVQFLCKRGLEISDT